MARFAYYKSSDQAPQRVRGWYDTALTKEPPFGSEDLLELNEEQWAAHMSEPLATWEVHGGKLQPHMAVPSLTTPAQQALAAINAGLTIRCPLDSSLDSIYGTDMETHRKLQSILLFISQHNRFPGNVQAYPWPDRNGKPHMFTMAQFQTLAMVIQDYIATLDIIGINDSGTLPPPEAEI